MYIFFLDALLDKTYRCYDPIRCRQYNLLMSPSLQLSYCSSLTQQSSTMPYVPLFIPLPLQPELLTINDSHDHTTNSTVIHNLSRVLHCIAHLLVLILITYFRCRFTTFRSWLSISLKKGIRSTTTHPISQYITYDFLFSAFQSFTLFVSVIPIPKSHRKLYSSLNGRKLLMIKWRL